MTNDYEGGSYTLSEDKTILTELFAVDRDGKNITDEDWKRIAGKLKRNPQYVHHHWLYTLEPVLTRYKAGTLNMAVKNVLLDHLVENNMDYTQDVDWKELAKLPKFAGTTSAYLSQMYALLRSNTGMKYPELSEEHLNTEAIRRYRVNTKRISTSYTILEHQEIIVKFYLSDILKK